ncbi:MAG: alkaline phosphatase D family protein, partial [Actinomycetota bacterium]|nr:alkaline phosphatase D family protein [Actinomycetota bacterium]
MDRRSFIRGSAAALVASPGVGIPLFSSSSSTPSGGVFHHGVAAGDPGPHGAIIWTRVTPTSQAFPGSGAGDPVQVEWQVSRRPSFDRIAMRGKVESTRRRDHTVKVGLYGLEPDKSYFYRFRARGDVSRVGHFRTLPAEGQLSSLRFGFTSCANLQHGYFAAYRHLAEHENLRFVLHLGDYIYETQRFKTALEGRHHVPAHEAVTLADYRRRHGQYKRDWDLQRVHAAHAFISTWDDHEIANNSWKAGAEGHDRKSEGSFYRRRRAAYRAFLEWMPLRLPAPQQQPTRIYRGTEVGRSLDLLLVDSRQYRARGKESGTGGLSGDMLGDRQMRWLKQRLSQSNARWRIIGSQVLFAPRHDRVELDKQLEGWEAFAASRRNLVRYISDRRIENVVLLTGDTHVSWANDIPIDTQTYPVTPAAAVEFGVPSISSSNFDDGRGLRPRNPQSLAAEAKIRGRNPHVKFVEVDSHGYCVVAADKERLKVDYHYIKN